MKNITLISLLLIKWTFLANTKGATMPCPTVEVEPIRCTAQIVHLFSKNNFFEIKKILEAQSDIDDRDKVFLTPKNYSLELIRIKENPELFGQGDFEEMAKRLEDFQAYFPHYPEFLKKQYKEESLAIKLNLAMINGDDIFLKEVLENSLEVFRESSIYEEVLEYILKMKNSSLLSLLRSHEEFPCKLSDLAKSGIGSSEMDFLLLDYHSNNYMCHKNKSHFLCGLLKGENRAYYFERNYLEVKEIIKKYSISGFQCEELSLKDYYKKLKPKNKERTDERKEWVKGNEPYLRSELVLKKSDTIIGMKVNLSKQCTQKDLNHFFGNSFLKEVDWIFKTSKKNMKSFYLRDYHKCRMKLIFTRLEQWPGLYINADKNDFNQHLIKVIL